MDGEEQRLDVHGKTSLALPEDVKQQQSVRTEQRREDYHSHNQHEIHPRLPVNDIITLQNAFSNI